MRRRRAILFAIIVFACELCFASIAMGVDHPHDVLDCGDCHVAHKTGGPALQTEANANLCMSCHHPENTDTTHNFNIGDQAVPGTSGTSHSWTAVLDPNTCFPTDCGPDSRYGVRKPAANWSYPLANEIQSGEINRALALFNYAITCSVCHDQHSHDGVSWDFSKGDSGTATGGSLNTVQDTNKTWDVNQWVDYAVKLTSGLGSGEIRKIQSNTDNTLTVVSNFSTTVTDGTTYTIYGGSFQRIDNDLNQLCEDCHYYRVKPEHTDVRTYDGKLKSHPVAVIFTNANGETPDISDTTSFNSAPLEPNGSAQTGSRYQDNGGSDTNLTNNLVVDRLAKIRCLTCHGIHYTDSISSSVDGP